MADQPTPNSNAFAGKAGMAVPAPWLRALSLPRQLEAMGMRLLNSHLAKAKLQARRLTLCPFLCEPTPHVVRHERLSSLLSQYDCLSVRLSSAAVFCIGYSE